MGTMIRDMGMGREEAWWELPLVEAFAYQAWQLETDRNPFGGGLERVSDGYVAQERERISNHRGQVHNRSNGSLRRSTEGQRGKGFNRRDRKERRGRREKNFNRG